MDEGQDKQADMSGRPPNFGFSVTRVLQDGPDTFVKAVHEPEGGAEAWLTMSLIRTDDSGLMSVRRQISVSPVCEERIVSSMAAYAIPNGPQENTDTSRTQVRGFIDAVMAGADRATLEPFIDRVAFDLLRTGPSGERERLDQLIARRGPRDGVRYHGIDDLVAEGDFAAVFSCFDDAGQNFRACDLFRLADGMIVEHWDAIQPVASHTVAHNDES